MKYFNKLLPFSLYVALCLCIKAYASVSGYSLDDLQENKDVLRTIATKIVSTEGNIELIKAELKRKHGMEAFKLWSTYNQDTLPTVENLKTLGISNDITLGKPIDSKFRAFLKNFVGKTVQTAFPDETISKIDVYLLEAIKKGDISLTANKMLVEQTTGGDFQPDSLEVKYHLSIPLAKIYQKEKTSPPKVTLGEMKNNMIIIMFAKEFIDALLSDKQALETQNFQGRINSVYVE